MDTGLSSPLADLLVAHGGRWQIGQDAHTGVWTAIERPTPTRLTYHVAHTLAELAAKLDAEGSEAGA